MATALLASERLVYRRLTAADLDAFHMLVVDDHVRRYLLDGETMGRDWCSEQILASDTLFASQGLGLWLVNLRDSEPKIPIGFCGFIRFAATGPEPQLLYAVLAAHTGRGYATEMARALVAYAAKNTSLSVLFSAVDEPNAASSRVLEKVGFASSGSVPGAFGRILQYRYSLSPSVT